MDGQPPVPPLDGSEPPVPRAGKAKEADTANDGPLRPHYGITVNPDHGLYAFFRRTDTPGLGEPTYETIEAMDPAKTGTGRSWSAAELRMKSFKDLHTLWYVVLRERNLLATQAEEARRMGVQGRGSLSVVPKMYQCRKTMARIKYVMNERRLAYGGALHLQGVARELALKAPPAPAPAPELAADAADAQPEPSREVQKPGKRVPHWLTQKKQPRQAKAPKPKKTETLKEAKLREAAKAAVRRQSGRVQAAAREAKLKLESSGTAAPAALKVVKPAASAQKVASGPTKGTQRKQRREEPLKPKPATATELAHEGVFASR